MTNDYDGVLDEGISKGQTNWQMYGSRKPDNEAYKLVKHTQFIYNMSEDEFEYKNLKVESSKIFSYLKTISARSKPAIKAVISEEYIELYEKNKPKKSGKRSKPKKRMRNAFTIHGIEDTIGNINSVFCTLLYNRMQIVFYVYWGLKIGI